MKKHNQPILNQLHNTINWLHNFAPNSFVGLIVFILFITVVTTCNSVKASSKQSLSPNDTLVVIPVDSVCKVIKTARLVGVICSNGQFLFTGQNLDDKCKCGQYYIQYWIGKYKTKDI